MRTNQMVTGRVEQDRKAPRVPKRYKARFLRVEIDVHDSSIRNLILSHLGSVESHALLRVQNCHLR